MPCCFSRFVEALAGEPPSFNGSSATGERNGGGGEVLLGEIRDVDTNSRLHIIV